MAKSKNMKRHQLVLNLDDPYQKKLNDYLMQFTNTSGHLRSLVQNDFEGSNAWNRQPPPIQFQEQRVSQAIDQPMPPRLDQQVKPQQQEQPAIIEDLSLTMLVYR